MLTSLMTALPTAALAHAGQPPAPHDLWALGNFDPLVLAILLAAYYVHERARPRGAGLQEERRARALAAALVVLGVALASPLDALSSALASAHMVQHILLVLVAAPLLAYAAPSSRLLRAAPGVLRRRSGHWRRRMGAQRWRMWLASPVIAWSAHVGVLWLWHAAVLYDAALASPAVHLAEHASFLLTGVLFWRVVLSWRPGARVPTGLRVSPGLAVVLVFTMALQSVFLSLLLTFARAAWYSGYTASTAAWGLTPLADQQLAGVIMWVPAGMVYLAAGLASLVAWLRQSEEPVGVAERRALQRL